MAVLPPPTALFCHQVIKAAASENRLRGKAKELLENPEKGEAAALKWIKGKMYNPQYSSLVQLPVGVGE
jgi:hypothetical protein